MPPSPHTFACQLRWADMDMLGHVNNVRYLDYVAAARTAALGELPAAGATVLGHQVDFAAPLVFRRQPVLVDTWVSGLEHGRLTLAHEVYDAPDDTDAADDEPNAARTVYLRVSTELDHAPDEAEAEQLADMGGDPHRWRPLTHEARPPRASVDVRVRPSDLDAHGRARDGMLFEYLQEARIRYFMDLHTHGQVWSHHVVARTDVRVRGAITFREAPYAVHSWVGHLGTKSFTICAEIRDGDTVLVEADVVMVTFDRETQRPAAMTASQRERLEAELR